MIHSIATVGSYTLLSRLLGFVRDMMMAALLGAGPLADAFLVAFKLPNFLRRLFAEGAFNAGFVPLFARTLEADGDEVARRFAEQAQAVLAAILVPVVMLGIFFMPWLITLMAPGFEPDGERYQNAVDLSRITFIYILFISLVALYSGVLNSAGRFAAAAAAPIVLNLCMITAMLLSHFWLGAPAHMLAWSLALAGLAQLLWLMVAAKRAGFVLWPRRPRLSPEIRRLFMLILPGVLGASVAQISLFADVIFASLLPAGAVSYLYYADRVGQLPLGVIGVAVGTALLPLMARQLRAGEEAAALYSQNRALELALLLTLPAAIGLAVISHPIIVVLFERGAFTAADSRATALALAAYAAGIPAYVLVKVLAPGFFAREDTKTPVKIALLCLGANVVAALILIWPLKHVGIALATVISSWLNCGLLAWTLHKRSLFQPDRRLIERVPRMVGAGLLMALAIWLLRQAGLDLGALPGLLIALGAGGASYLGAAQLLGAFDFAEVRAQLLRRRA